MGAGTVTEFRGSGLWVKVAGRWFRAHGPNLREPSVFIAIDDEDRGLFREVREPPPRLAARVAADEMEALVSVKARGRLEGAEVSVEELDEGTALVYLGGPDWVAELYGLEGSYYDGWLGRVPREAVTDIVTFEKDRLAP